MTAERGLPRGMLAAFGVWSLATCVIAVRVPLDYWDGFEFLTNAVLLAGHGDTVSSGYSMLRPPLWPLLLAPLHLVTRSPGAYLWLPHLFSALVAVAAIAAGYRLFRLSFGAELSAVGAAALALNRLTTHYAAFALADVLSMLTVIVTLHAWLRARTRRGVSGFALAGVLAGLSVSSKYPLAMLPAALALFELARAAVPGSGRDPSARVRWRGLVAPGPWLGGLLAAMTPVAVLTLVVGLAMRPFDRAQVISSLQFLMQIGRDAKYDDPWWEHLQTAWILFSAPLLACALLGAVEALRARRDGDLLHLLWTVTYFAAMTWWSQHREARYLLPIVPSLVWLALRGAQQLWTLVPSLRGWRWPAGVAFLAMPALGSADEARRFFTPPYSQPVMREIAQFVAASGRAPYFVTGGRAWSVFPPEPVVFPHDEYMHFHHLSAVAFEYFAGRKQTPPELASREQQFAVIQLPGAWYDGMNASQLPTMPDAAMAGFFRGGQQAETRKFAFTGQ